MKLEDLQTLSETEISDRALPLDQLWWVRGADGEALGPYDTPTLRSFRTQNPDACAELEASTLASDAFSPLMEIEALAARRPPQLMSAAALKTPERHYVLTNGQASGPHSTDAIRNMLQDGRLGSSDYVSVDECANWQRIYEHKHLLLTAHAANTLPPAPRAPVTDEDSPPPFNTVVDGLASLAHLCHQHRGSAVQAPEWEEPIEAPADGQDQPKRRWHYASALAACGLAAFMVWRTPEAPTTNPDEIELAMPSEATESAPSWMAPARAAKTAPVVRRRPASVSHARPTPPPPSPVVMRDAPPEMMRYQETHDEHREPPEPSQPLDVDPYADTNVAEASPERGPAGEEAPAIETTEDDGYRLLPPGKDGAVVEEVGDF